MRNRNKTVHLNTRSGKYLTSPFVSSPLTRTFCWRDGVAPPHAYRLDRWLSALLARRYGVPRQKRIVRPVKSKGIKGFAKVAAVFLDDFCEAASHLFLNTS